MRSLTIDNPKRQRAESIPSSWYPFYPGFSEKFARTIVSSAGLAQDDWVLDPWNGSGTTTSATISLGVNAYGFDLNPVMVLVAKARSLDPSEYSSIRPLSSELRLKSRRAFDLKKDDPLLSWLVPESAGAIQGSFTRDHCS
jgi:DNA methylase